MAYNKRFLNKFAKGVSNGLSATEAYLRCRPNVKRTSAATQASTIMRTPGYLMARALVEGVTEDNILTRVEIRRLLTLAVLTPKDAESLALPENRWLITGIALSESATGSRQSIKAVNAVQALIALAKMDGYREDGEGDGAQNEGLAALEKSPLYGELLAQEAAVQLAKRVRESSATVGQV